MFSFHLSISRASVIDAFMSSYLLTFAYVEVMEQKKDYAEVHATFEKFLGLQSKILDELQKNSPDPANGSFNETQPASQSTNASYNSQSSDERSPKPTELQERRTEYGLAYIFYMRFARRAEGLQALRKVFGKARKDKWAPWEVYEASGKSFSSLLSITCAHGIYSPHGIPLLRRQGCCQPDL